VTFVGPVFTVTGQVSGVGAWFTKGALCRWEQTGNGSGFKVRCCQQRCQQSRLAQQLPSPYQALSKNPKHKTLNRAQGFEGMWKTPKP